MLTFETGNSSCKGHRYFLLSERDQYFLPLLRLSDKYSPFTLDSYSTMQNGKMSIGCEWENGGTQSGDFVNSAVSDSVGDSVAICSDVHQRYRQQLSVNGS